jgi:hypothetical protein
MDAAVSVELFVEILNRYVYYFDQQNEAVRTFSSIVIRSDPPGALRGPLRGAFSG